MDSNHLEIMDNNSLVNGHDSSFSDLSDSFHNKVSPRISRAVKEQLGKPNSNVILEGKSMFDGKTIFKGKPALGGNLSAYSSKGIVNGDHSS